MFTGIIETLGEVKTLTRESGNLHIEVASGLVPELKVDQSVAHNGVCLTVVSLTDRTYTVTAVEETLQKSNLGELKTGDLINLERSMVMGARLDGHIVQGHVDQTAVCTLVEETDGSWRYRFEYDPLPSMVTVEKGSITVDGVSLTVVNSRDNSFEVAIIPYTWEHTRFKTYRKGDRVNLEFDILGKYVARLLGQQQAAG
jgi:riboflavin synthase